MSPARFFAVAGFVLLTFATMANALPGWMVEGSAVDPATLTAAKFAVNSVNSGDCQKCGELQLKNEELTLKKVLGVQTQVRTPRTSWLGPPPPPLQLARSLVWGPLLLWIQPHCMLLRRASVRALWAFFGLCPGYPQLRKYLWLHLHVTACLTAGRGRHELPPAAAGRGWQWCRVRARHNGLVASLARGQELCGRRCLASHQG